jgi:hypothetical protein
MQPYSIDFRKKIIEVREQEGITKYKYITKQPY